MELQEKLYTASDFWEFTQHPDKDTQRFDLIEGEIREMAPAGEEHGDIASELNMLIRLFVKEHNLGRVTAAETGYVLHVNPNGRDTVLAPDVGFTSWETANQRAAEKFAPNPPDLAVEVVSPNDAAAEIQEKVLKYLQYGTKLVWVVYPRTQTVEVHDNSGTKRLGPNVTLDGGTVLPGFKILVKNCFP